MASIQDGPNPYRPYHIPSSHIPPSIDATVQPAINTTRTSSKFDLGSSARDVLSDLDYSDYLSDASPSVLEVLKKLIDQGLWKYTSVLLAQPFENAKIILQVQDTGSVNDGNIRQDRQKDYRDRDREREDPYLSEEEEDSDNDTQSYFTSSAPTPNTRSRREHFAARRRYSSSRSRSRHSRSSRQSYISSREQTSHTKALNTTSSLTTVISSLWASEGAWGVWKGTNSTFWHSVALSTITSFLRSFLCAVFALPDPTVSITALPSQVAKLDILSSPAPLTSLILSISASGLAGLMLSPLDIARTKLITTPSTHPPRSIFGAITSLGSWGVSSSIAHITLLHSTLPTLITASTPLFLRNRLGLDQATNPTSFAFLTLVSQTVELGIRLPIETALRRGQLHIIKSASINQPSRTRSTATTGESAGEFETTVPIGSYKGLWGTWYHITSEEGSRAIKASSGSSSTAASTLKRQTLPAEAKRRKGQGIEGLFRGWKLSAWGLAGMWTAHFVGAGGGVAGGGGAGGAGGF